MTIEPYKMTLTDEIGWARGWQEFIDDVKTINVANGWFDAERDDLTSCMLIVTEVAELAEAYRDSEEDTVTDAGKPVGPLSEIADIIVRVADLMYREDYTGEDLVRCLIMKSNYNATRGYRHGGKTS